MAELRLIQAQLISQAKEEFAAQDSAIAPFEECVARAEASAYQDKRNAELTAARFSATSDEAPDCRPPWGIAGAVGCDADGCAILR